MSRIDIDKSISSKVSTVFLTYSEPFLNTVLADKVNPTCKDLENALRIPWMIWNAYYQKQQGNKIDYTQLIIDSIQDIPAKMKKLIAFMIARRESEFSRYDYMIGMYKYRINQSTGEFILTAEARKG